MLSGSRHSSAKLAMPPKRSSRTRWTNGALTRNFITSIAPTSPLAGESKERWAKSSGSIATKGILKFLAQTENEHHPPALGDFGHGHGGLEHIMAIHAAAHAKLFISRQIFRPKPRVGHSLSFGIVGQNRLHRAANRPSQTWKYTPATARCAWRHRSAANRTQPVPASRFLGASGARLNKFPFALCRRALQSAPG